MKYGLWSTAATATSVLNYLAAKNIGDELWFGVVKKTQATTTTSSGCATVPIADVHTNLAWASSVSTPLLSSLFSSPHTVNFYSCSNLNILVKRDNNKFVYRDEGDQQKRFICVWEDGECLQLLLLLLKAVSLKTKKLKTKN